MSLYLGSEQQTLELLHEYADEIHRTTPPGTELIVLPEKVGRVSEKILPEVDAIFNAPAVNQREPSLIRLARAKLRPVLSIQRASIRLTAGRRTTSIISC